MNDDRLDRIARQARLAYATYQLQTCQAALQRWQVHIEQSPPKFDPERVQFEITYHAQQIERWHDYLAALGPVEPLFTCPE